PQSVPAGRDQCAGQERRAIQGADLGRASRPVVGRKPHHSRILQEAERQRRMTQAYRRWLFVTVAAISMPAWSRLSAQAQAADTSALMRAMLLESDGKYKQAAPLYRASLHGADGQSAFLGLDLVYAELGWTGSLLARVDSLL